MFFEFLRWSELLIADGIAAYSPYQANGSIPENTSMIDFVLKAVGTTVVDEQSGEECHVE